MRRVFSSLREAWRPLCAEYTLPTTRVVYTPVHPSLPTTPGYTLLTAVHGVLPATRAPLCGAVERRPWALRGELAWVKVVPRLVSSWLLEKPRKVATRLLGC